MDAIMTTDGDCAILGANKLCFNVNSNNETFQSHDKTNDTIDKVRNPILACETEKWTVTSSLLGNDCVKRDPNVGHATIFNKTLPK